jgi:hypothetical protein
MTRVLFRVWKGEVIALFILEPAVAHQPHLCLSYMHVGQHSAADPVHVIRNSRPATAEEYRALADELTEHFGYQLQVGRRAPTNAYRVRYNAIVNSFGGAQ